MASDIPYEFKRDDLLAYSREIESVTKEAKNEFRQIARSIIDSKGDPSTWTRQDIDNIRDEVSDLMSEMIEIYGDANQSITTRVFEAILDDQGFSEDISLSERSFKKTSQASSRQWARKLYEDVPDIEGYLEGVSNYVERHVSHSSDYCILEAANGKRFRKRVRYARVPLGPSCGFCIMLSSRGFVYATNESAGEFAKFHNKCDCRIIAGLPGISVEGYDYEGMRKRYQQCRDALGSDKNLWNDFQALSQEERDSYGRGDRIVKEWMNDDLVKKIGKQADAFDDYVAHRISREMNTRDRQWLFDGTIPKPLKESGAKPLTKEEETARLLSEHGFKIEFRKTREDKNKKTSDVNFISGKKGKEQYTAWEFKQPVGDGKQNIANQFQEAAGQSDKLVIDATKSPIKFDEICDRARTTLEIRSDFSEVIVINEVRIRKLIKMST